jgi:hypothetical protein
VAVNGFKPSPITAGMTAAEEPKTRPRDCVPAPARYRHPGDVIRLIAAAALVLLAVALRHRRFRVLATVAAGILLGTSCALVTALTADQFQRRRNRLQRPAGTQFLAGVPPAHHAEDGR